MRPYLIVTFEDATEARTPYVLTDRKSRPLQITQKIAQPQFNEFRFMNEFERAKLLPPQGRSNSILSNPKMEQANVERFAGDAYVTLKSFSESLAERTRFMRARYSIIDKKTASAHLMKDERRCLSLASALDASAESHCHVDLGRLEQSEIGALLAATSLSATKVEYGQSILGDAILGALCTALYRAIGIFPAGIFQDPKTGIMGLVNTVRRYPAPEKEIYHVMDDAQLINPMEADKRESALGHVRPHAFPNGYFPSLDPSDRQLKMLPTLNAVQIKVLEGGLVKDPRDQTLSDPSSIFLANAFSFRLGRPHSFTRDQLSDYGGKPIATFDGVPTKSLKMGLRVQGLTPDVSLKELIVLLAILFQQNNDKIKLDELRLDNPEFIAFVDACCNADELRVPKDALVELGAYEADAERGRPKAPNEPRQFSCFEHLREQDGCIVYPKMNPAYARLVNARLKDLNTNDPDFTVSDLADEIAKKRHAHGNTQMRSYKHPSHLLDNRYVSSRYTRSVKSAEDLRRINAEAVSSIEQSQKLSYEDKRRQVQELNEKLKSDLEYAAVYGSKPGTLGIHNEALVLADKNSSAMRNEAVGIVFDGKEENLKQYGTNLPTYYYLIHADGLPNQLLRRDTPAIARAEKLVEELFTQKINVSGARYAFKFKIWNGRCAIIVEPTVAGHYISRALADQLVMHSALTDFNQFVTGHQKFRNYVDERLYVRFKKGISQADRYSKNLDSFTVQITLKGGPERFEELLLAYANDLRANPRAVKPPAQLGLNEDRQLMRWPSAFFLAQSTKDDELLSQLQALAEEQRFDIMASREFRNLGTIFHLIFQLKAIKSFEFILKHLGRLPANFLTESLASMDCFGYTPLFLLFGRSADDYTRHGYHNLGTVVLKLFNLLLPYMLVPGSPEKILAKSSESYGFRFEFKPEFRVITNYPRETQRGPIYIVDMLFSHRIDGTSTFISNEIVLLFDFMQKCSEKRGAFSFDPDVVSKRGVHFEPWVPLFPSFTIEEIEVRRDSLLDADTRRQLPPVVSFAEEEAKRKEVERQAEEARLAHQRQEDERRRRSQESERALRVARAREKLKAEQLLGIVAHYFPEGNYKSAFMLKLVDFLQSKKDSDDKEVTLTKLSNHFGLPHAVGLFASPDARRTAKREAALHEAAANPSGNWQGNLDLHYRTDCALDGVIRHLAAAETEMRP